MTELGHMLFRDEQDPSKTGVSAERLHDELFKMAEAGGPALADFLEKLDETDLLDKFLPEVKAMQGVEQQPEHHPEGDVSQHVLAALRASPVKVNVPTTSPTAAHTTIISTEFLAPSTSAVMNAVTPIRVWGLIQLTKTKEKIA